MGNRINNGSYVLPVSSGQEQLYFLSSIDEKLNAAYNINIAFKITRHINRIVLQNAINYVVLRHEALRTGICKLDNTLKQVVEPDLMITVQYWDLGQFESYEKEKEVLKRMKLEAKKPFQLHIPGLFRVSLYRVEPNIFYLLLVLHHSIADGISIEILVSEIFTVYRQILESKSADLPSLKYQFADIIAWQSEKFHPSLVKEHTEYWSQKLSGANTATHLERSKAQKVSSFDGQAIFWDIEKNDLNAITEQCKSNKISTYCLLISAFALLIHYHSGYSDFLIGIPTANRDAKESWPIIGYFSNTVVIRINFNATNSVAGLLQQINESINEALTYQSLPISKIVNILKPKRTEDFGTIFQFMFSYQESSDIKKILDNFGAQQIFVDNNLSKFDLFLYLLNEGESLKGIIEYSTDLFEHSYILELIQHYQAICNVLSQDVSLLLYDKKLLNNLDMDLIKDRINEVSSDERQESKRNGLSQSRKQDLSALEEKLILIWREVLGIHGEISIEDSFFDLGGNSLLVTKLVDHMNRVLNINLPIKVIFLNPYIKKIAEYIESAAVSNNVSEKDFDRILQVTESAEFIDSWEV